MKRINFNILNILMLVSGICLGFTSCSSDDEVEPVHEQQVSRTVLAYIVATNSLSGADEQDLGQMKQAVEAGALDNGGSLLVYRTAYGVTPELVRVNSDGSTTVLRQYNDGVNSLDPDFMAGVITDAMSMAPADEFGLILWSHSTGWLGLKRQQVAASRTFGDDRGNLMPIPLLAEVFERLPRLTFIYFDSCFMGNVESMYELRDAAEWVVASPAETPYDGAPYDVSLASLFAPVPEGLCESARLVYDYYLQQPSLTMRSSTVSVYKMSALEELADAVTDAYASTDQVESLGGIQQYGFPRSMAYFPDLFFDFEDYMTARGAMTLRVESALSDVIYAYYATPTMWGLYPMDNVCGMSVFPYEELSLAGNRYSYTDMAWYHRVYNIESL